MEPKQPKGQPSPPKPPLPLSLGLGLAAGLVGLLVAALRRRGSFALAFGDALVIEALLLFGLAWVGYLKKDGIRIFPPRKEPRDRPAESWKDRVPALGEAPPPPPAVPGAEGPSDPAYERLAQAEEELRRKILGAGRGEGGAAEDSARSWSFIGSLALAGAVLLGIGLCFEYLLPRLLP